MNFSKILDRVPDYKDYMGIDELNANSECLAKEHADVIKVLNLGRTLGGETINCLKIGVGSRNALIYGFPNPEEPFGGILIDHLSSALVEDRTFLEKFDYTWYLIKCIDPDGAKLNEGFLKAPHTPLKFTKNYYRTPGHLSGEMNMPYRSGGYDFNNPVPETKALMKIMNGKRLDFISSLHMMKWGGISYQVTEKCPTLYSPLQFLAQEYNIPLRKRAGRMIAPGIQLAGYMNPVRMSMLRNEVGRDVRGAFSFEYAQLNNPRVFMMIPECCIWSDPRILDDRPSDKTMAEVIDYQRQTASEANKFSKSIYERASPRIKTDSPFFEMMKPQFEGERAPAKPLPPRTLNFAGDLVQFTEKQWNRTYNIAEKVAMEGRDDLYRMFNLGTLRRMIDAHISQHSDSKLETIMDEIDAQLNEWNDFLNKKYSCTAYPLRDLVGMSLGSILYAMEYAKR